MRLTDDILARFAMARELDQRAKAIAAERGERVTTEMYSLALKSLAELRQSAEN